VADVVHAAVRRAGGVAVDRFEARSMDEDETASPVAIGRPAARAAKAEQLALGL
jgi:hypothetical protein